MKLLTKIIGAYKLNLLVSLTLSVVIIALRVEKSWVNVVSILLGCVTGTFFMELEYFTMAYLNDMYSDFSRTFKDLMDQGNYVAVISHIRANRYSLKQRTMHSVLFQISLAAILYFLTTSSASLFSFSLVISVFVQTFYLMYEEFDERRDVSSWFWILKEAPSRTSIILYLLAMGLFLVYILSKA